MNGLRRLPRWVLPALGSGIIALTATVVLILRVGGAGCAARSAESGATRPPAGWSGAQQFRPNLFPAAVEARSGKATHYEANGGGNCSFEALGPGMYVALSPSEYAAGAACGGYLDVSNAKGTVRVKVTDQCPECPAGHIDLSKEAFAKLGALVTGELAVSYRPVKNPPVIGALTARIKEGASRYWFAVRLDNHGNPLASVEVKSGSGWVRLTHTDYNYWLKSDGAGPGPFTLRLVDTGGRTATLAGVTLSPGQVQQTSVSMSGGATTATPSATGTSATSSPTAPAPPSPSGSGATVSNDTPTGVGTDPASRTTGLAGPRGIRCDN